MTLRAGFGLRRGSLSISLNLEAEPGTVLALLGPNGAGKTTVLRALAGLQAIESGEVRLGATVLDAPAGRLHVPPEERSIGFVFQDHLLFPHLSVLENVASGLRFRGRREARQAAERWLERLGLLDQAAHRPRQLSGGQAQRVALARALAPGPALLLLDEPLASLDASVKVAVRRDLKHHLAEFGGVTVLVTHDPLDAALLAAKVLVIENGRAVQGGTLAEITAQPRSPYVADLVGVNLWRGTARGGSIVAGSFEISAAHATDGEVFALVRPRSVSVYLERPHGSPRNVWRGVVGSMDVTGDRVRVRVESPVPVVAEITPAALADLGLAGGEEVWVSFKASEVETYPA